MRIAWAITGAGHLLKETIDILEELSTEHKITVFLSRAGEEVLKIYGLYPTIQKITTPTEKYRTIIHENDQKYSYPISGRFSMSQYDILIVSPTTSNTTAKIVHGIADTLVTNIIGQAGKGGIPTYIIPVDTQPGDIETVLPSKLEHESCQECTNCQPAEKCPENAIIPHKEIDLTRCIGCGTCKNTCPYNAISEGKIITLHMRPIDIENTEKLKKFKEITIIESPNKIKEVIGL